jgi:hypothetical protein
MIQADSYMSGEKTTFLRKTRPPGHGLFRGESAAHETREIASNSVSVFDA